MAADGAWPEDRGDDGRTHRAVQQLRVLLDDLEVRLGEPPTALPRVVVTDGFVEALQTLARRVTETEAEAAGRFAQLGAAISQLAERLDAQALHQAEAAAQNAEREADLVRRLDQLRVDLAYTGAAREPWLPRTVVTVASAAAAFSVMGAATLAIGYGRDPDGPRADVREYVPPVQLSLRPGLGPETPAARPRAPAPMASVNLSTRPPPGRAETYNEVSRALGRGETTALPRLTGLAQAGDQKAQLHLASLYEAGSSGLPRDLPAARAWTQRAAEGGDRVAMHNLALFLMRGEGGPRDFGAAAAWFRRAADLGVVDSQYNLGLIYEAGQGVVPNLRDAYRWFSIAANAGDLASREKALALEARLKPGERLDLDRDAGQFAPGAPPTLDPATVIPPATTLAETQALLARKGYYVGPVDGILTADVRAAALAYVRDHPGSPVARSSGPPS